jgi:hypothetical protein
MAGLARPHRYQHPAEPGAGAGQRAESAFQLNVEQASNVVNGLLSFEEISRVALRDNFGNVLAWGSRPGPRPASSALGDALIAGMETRKLTLDYTDTRSGGQSTHVGQLEVTLDGEVIGQRFAGLALSKMAFAVTLAILLSLLLGVVFYFCHHPPPGGHEPAHRRTGPGRAGPRTRCRCPAGTGTTNSAP